MNDVQRILYLLITAIVIGFISVIVTFIYLVQITNATKQQSEDNYKVLTLQLPGLQRQIRKLEEENAATEYVLNQQAVPAVIYLLRQVEMLGGKPPQILLNPEEPPFNPK